MGYEPDAAQRAFKLLKLGLNRLRTHVRNDVLGCATTISLAGRLTTTSLAAEAPVERGRREGVARPQSGLHRLRFLWRSVDATGRSASEVVQGALS